MLSAILGWLGLNPLDKLFSALGDAYKAKLSADNDEAKTRAEVSIEVLRQSIEAHKQQNEIRLATAGFWEMRLMTAIIAGCFTLHLAMVTLDTCFKLGWKVFAFPEPFAQWEGAILLSFFGIQAGTKAVTAIAASLSRKN